jgi:hypothetical protein
MPAYPRHEIVADDRVGLYHCIVRCVRRAFLCGEDPVSGKNFDHRKEWIRLRLQELAAVFGIDICGYAVMSNHFHIVLRVRPDLAQGRSSRHPLFGGTEWQADESRWRPPRCAVVVAGSRVGVPRRLPFSDRSLGAER